MTTCKNNDNQNCLSQLEPLNNVNFLLGTVLVGDNIDLFTNTMDLTIFDDYRNSDKNYDDYDVKYAIPLLLYDIDVVAKEAVLINRATWNFADNIKFTIDYDFDNKLVSGVILIENGCNNLNYMKGVRKSDTINLTESTDDGTMILINKYYDKLQKMADYINKLMIKANIVISFDSINWLYLTDLIKLNRNIDFSEKMNDLLSDVGFLDFLAYRNIVENIFKK